MTIISDAEKEQMAHLRSLMEGVSFDGPVPETPYDHQTSVVSTNCSDNDIAEMKMILENLKSVTDSASKTAIVESKIDRTVRDAMATEKTTRGIRYGGKWDIIVEEIENGNKPLKYYSIVHSDTNSVIAKDLILYEVAHYVVRLLNEGKYINHPNIVEMLNKENSFYKYRTDAKDYARKISSLTKSGDSRRVDVYEARYVSAKDKAKSILSEIRQMYKSS
ncbi:MAG: hypothetical protein WC284_07820 [Candidimonas sp.]